MRSRTCFDNEKCCISNSVVQKKGKNCLENIAWTYFLWIVGVCWKWFQWLIYDILGKFRLVISVFIKYGKSPGKISQWLMCPRSLIDENVWLLNFKLALNPYTRIPLFFYPRVYGSLTGILYYGYFWDVSTELQEYFEGVLPELEGVSRMF